ncbi:hypothetical protein [Streptomyces canus]|uniref:hypothetical protein n=1 Tax=Streptomyces canus TaxID=58343 RepID=UPI002E2A449F|nr:hypothetical protein [Streptomyces canus]
MCTRAITEQGFSGAILAADTLIVIVALAWLLPAQARRRRAGLHERGGLPRPL